VIKIKELLVTIGLIILGGIIVTTLVLGTGTGTLQNAASGVVSEGIEAITSIAWPYSLERPMEGGPIRGLLQWRKGKI